MYKYVFFFIIVVYSPNYVLFSYFNKHYYYYYYYITINSSESFVLVLFVGFKYIGVNNSSENVSIASEAKSDTKPSKEELKKKLTPLQYKVTQENGTERAFSNEYWDNKQQGIYVDIVSGEPLFSSKDKFKSGTGWPSLYDVIKVGNVGSGTDNKFGMARTEIKCTYNTRNIIAK